MENDTPKERARQAGLIFTLARCHVNGGSGAGLPTVRAARKIADWHWFDGGDLAKCLGDAAAAVLEARGEGPKGRRVSDPISTRWWRLDQGRGRARQTFWTDVDELVDDPIAVIKAYGERKAV